MGIPVVIKAAGGLPVTVATNGYGLPMTVATNGFGLAVTQAPAGGSGLAVTGITFGPTIALSAASVLETAAVNTVVGTLSVTAGTTGSPVFALVDSAGGKFNISGTSLRTNALLDYETATSHTVIVSVSGVTPTVANATFIISVGDVAEPVIQLTGTTVNENATAGTNIGTLSIANSFTGSPVYTLVDSSSGKVAISGSNLNVLGAIDYETTPTFDITVSVSGITPAAANKAFTVVVLDVTEAAGTTWNPSDKSASISLDGTNLIATRNATNDGSFRSVRSIASHTAGKKYLEWKYDYASLGTGALLGAVDAGFSLEAGVGTSSNTLGYYTNDGQVYVSGGGAGASTPIAATASFICMALDLDNKKAWFRVGAGNWNASGTANPATNVGGVDITSLTGPWFATISIHGQGTTLGDQKITANFGASAWSGAGPPSGFVAWGGGALGTTKNIVTDYGAVGDAQWAQTTLSITTNVLTSATAIWSSATSGSEYIGKSIVVGKCGGSSGEAGGGTPLRTTIAGWTSATQITLASNCISTLSAEPNVIVAWGTACNTAFDNFRTAYQGQAVTLTIPAGNYLISAGNFGPMWAGIRNITVNATGATLCGGLFQLGSYAQYGLYGHSGYTTSVTAGATSITLRTPADVSKFVVGGYAMMSGFGLQAGGYPSNHQRFEYLKIVAIDSDSGSPTYGKITFLTPLVNSYLSTWPLYFDESISPNQQTSGGPATLYAMDPRFDHTAVINGLRIAHHPQMGVSGLNVIMNNCVFESIWGPHATMAKTLAFNTCLGTKCSMEVDKIVTSLALNGCDWSGLSFQSTCITDCVLDDTDIRYSITGTPWKITIRNGSTVGTISAIGVLAPGAGYGYSNELVVSNSTVNGFGAVSTHESGYRIPGKDGSNNGVNVDWPGISGGVITIPSSTYAGIYTPLWPVTNGKVFLRDDTDGFIIGSFTITNATQSGSNTLVTTTLSGGWPSRSGHKIGLVLHPAPICTFTSVTGCPEVVDLSNAGAAGLPLYSYSKRTYTGLIGASEYWQVWGRVKKVVVIVTTPSSAAASVSINLQASNILIKMSDFSNTTWAPVIDLNKTGTRTFDATANTYPVSSWSTTAVAAADTLPGMTEALWVPNNYRVVTSGTAAAAVFSVEVITDQG